MTEPHPQDPSTPSGADDPSSASHGSLRGSFVIVLCMAAFFVAAWLGLLALALERR